MAWGTLEELAPEGSICWAGELRRPVKKEKRDWRAVREDAVEGRWASSFEARLGASESEVFVRRREVCEILVVLRSWSS